MKYRFVQQFILEGFIKIIFVRTNENDADLSTKNLGSEKYNKHSSKLIIEKGS